MARPSLSSLQTGWSRSSSTEPWKAVEEAGAKPVLVSLEDGEIQGFEHLDKRDTFKVDQTVDEAQASDYDGLVLPGGVANPDMLRDERRRGGVRPSLLRGRQARWRHLPRAVDARRGGVVDGLTLTSFPSIQTDIRNAGGDWVDEEVHVDRGLVTSRKPDDLPAFCAKIVEEFCEGRHEKLAAATSDSNAS